MWNTIKTFRNLCRNLRKAVEKHPDFPTKVVNTHTTYRSISQNMNAYKRQNDSGKQTIESVLNEEVYEMLCDMFRKRWRRAEREWVDVVTVMLRIFVIIQKEKVARYKKIVEYLRNKRKAKFKELGYFDIHLCDTCPHYNRNALPSLGMCSIGHSASGCPLLSHQGEW